MLPNQGNGKLFICLSFEKQKELLSVFKLLSISIISSCFAFIPFQSAFIVFSNFFHLVDTAWTRKNYYLCTKLKKVLYGDYHIHDFQGKSEQCC